jgi:hypothetical protein
MTTTNQTGIYYSFNSDDSNNSVTIGPDGLSFIRDKLTIPVETLITSLEIIDVNTGNSIGINRLTLLSKALAALELPPENTSNIMHIQDTLLVDKLLDDNLLDNHSTTVAFDQIVLTDGTTTNTIDKNGYTTRNTINDTLYYLNFCNHFNTETGSIYKTSGITCNPFTNTINATTFNATTFNGTSSSALNLVGGLSGNIIYQSEENVTSFLANGINGQVLTTTGTNSPPIWKTQTASVGNFQYDDFNYQIGVGSAQGNLGMRVNGSFAGSGMLQIGSISGHTGIVRGGNIANASVFVSVSTYSSSNMLYILFDNILIGGQGLTFVFRPFFNGEITNADAIVGLWNATNFTSSSAGIYWKYVGTSNSWILYIDRNPTSTIVEGSQSNVWCKINIIRTGNLSFSSTFSIIGGSSVTGTGQVASATANTYIGWLWGNNKTNSTSKYMDIDYLSAEWNSNR